MIRWYLVFIQYVALCGAFTTRPPSIWSGFDPFFGSWFDSSSQGAQASDQSSIAAQGPVGEPVIVQVNVPTDPPVEPLTPPVTSPPVYETAPPTKPAGQTGTTEPSISLRELIRLAMGNAGERIQGATDILSNVFFGPSKDTSAGSAEIKTTTKSSATTTAASGPKETKPVQEIVTFALTSTPSHTPSQTTTSKVTSATTTPKPTTTTTTPTTTKRTTTTKRPTTTTTTTTTTTPTTTTPRIMLTTDKPISKMTLGEILMLQSKMNAAANQVTVKTTITRRGCYYKGQFYEPLMEIEKGQTGSWCYGTYCNHEGTVIHWDDHKCSTTPTTTEPTQPVAEQAGMADIINTARAAGMSMADLNRFASMIGMSGSSNAGTSAVGIDAMGANNIGNANSGQGCFHNGQWYAPGADIENLRDYGRCYGSYCDYNSNIVHWNNRCTATVPPPTSMGGMGQMGMGVQMGAMDQFGMGGQSGTGISPMEQMALAGLGIEGLGTGASSGMEGMGSGGMGGGMGGGGIGGMVGMAGLEGFGGGGMTGMGGMGGQGGMGTQSQGGLTMRQLQQLDLI